MTFTENILVQQRVEKLLKTLQINNARLAKFGSYLLYNYENFQEVDKSEIDEELNAENNPSEDRIEFLKSVNYQAIFAESLITAVNNSIENCLTEIIRTHLELYDDKKDVIPVPLSEFEKHDLDFLKSKYQNRYIDSKILNLKFYDKVQFCIEKLSFNLFEDGDLKNNLLELRDLRNLISHNNSKVNESFVSKYGNKFGGIGDILTLSFKRISLIFFLGAKVQLMLELQTVFQFSKKRENDLATDLLLITFDVLLGINQRAIRDRAIWSSFSSSVCLSVYIETLDYIIQKGDKRLTSTVSTFKLIKSFVVIVKMITENEEFHLIQSVLLDSEFCDDLTQKLPDELLSFLTLNSPEEIKEWFINLDFKTISESPKIRSYTSASLLPVLIILNEFLEFSNQ